VTWSSGLLGLVAGLLIATATAPVGVSGAVFLLPVQLSVLHVPSPSVTPTNLLFNVVATPGALLRYRRHGGLNGPLTRQLAAGTMPGVIAGAVIRVYAVPGPQVFRLIVAAFLLPLGAWLAARTLRPPRTPPAGEPSRRTVTALALVTPILAGRGVPVTKVAPAAPVSTFLTSVTGALTYAVLALVHTGGSIAPDWPLGLTCGAGGLIGRRRLAPAPRPRQGPAPAARWRRDRPRRPLHRPVGRLGQCHGVGRFRGDSHAEHPRPGAAAARLHP
jgi:uncharacterized protein